MKQEFARAVVDGANVPIVRDADQNRVEITIGDETAFLTYRLKDNVLSLIHTEVPPALRGKRIGDALAGAVLNDAKDHGLTVKPYCPFVAAFISRRPEYADLIDPEFAGGTPP
jgi:predicted GNAT family acetyltransferase